MMLAQYEKMAAGYDTKKGELLQQVAELTKINRELAGYLSKVLTKDTTVKLLHSLLAGGVLGGCARRRRRQELGAAAALHRSSVVGVYEGLSVHVACACACACACVRCLNTWNVA